MVLLFLVSFFSSVFGNLSKKKCRIKDSENLFPGHRGILDRLDGYIWSNYTLCRDENDMIVLGNTGSIVVNAPIGEVGLRATLKTNECNKNIALANKESLVIMGKICRYIKINSY